MLDRVTPKTKIPFFILFEELLRYIIKNLNPLSLTTFSFHLIYLPEDLVWKKYVPSRIYGEVFFVAEQQQTQKKINKIRLYLLTQRSHFSINILTIFNL